MNIMQYPIALPADYDMAIIRTRVATRAPLLDSLPGLYLKAYAIQERGVAGATVNQYAPFYLWHTAEAMSAFIGGAGFRGVCDSFGRPVIRHGVEVARSHGPAVREFPSWATRHDERFPDGGTVEDGVQRVRADVEVMSRDATLHTCAVSLDPSRWTLTRYTLWTSPPRHERGTLYQVLHLSMPGAAPGMPVGPAPRPSTSAA